MSMLVQADVQENESNALPLLAPMPISAVRLEEREMYVPALVQRRGNDIRNFVFHGRWIGGYFAPQES